MNPPYSNPGFALKDYLVRVVKPPYCKPVAPKDYLERVVKPPYSNPGFSLKDYLVRVVKPPYSKPGCF